MPDHKHTQIGTFLQSANLTALVAAAGAHTLGIAAASYLAAPIRLDLYAWSLLFIISLHMFTHWISAALHPSTSAFLLQGKNHIPAEAARRPLLYASLITLAASGTSLSGFFLAGGIPTVSWILIGTLLASCIPLAFSTALKGSGLSEIWQAVILAVLVPAFSFSLMTGELHRLLPMSTTALAAFWFSAVIITQLKAYAQDSIQENNNLTTRIGWQKAMFLHDAALEFGAFTLVLAYLLGYPTRISLSLLIVLPLVLTQVYHMHRIRNGYPPRFKLMEWTAAAIFFVTIYLQILGFFQ